MQRTLKCLHVIKATQSLTIQRLNIKILKNSHVAKGGREPVDEATCFSYVVPKIFASSLIVHINDNKFRIAMIIIEYFLYSFSFKLPLTVFINVHGCLMARSLFFFSFSRSPPLSISRNTTN